MRKQIEVFTTFHIRMDEKMYKTLHKASYMQNKPKAEIVREALQKYFDEIKIA